MSTEKRQRQKAGRQARLEEAKKSKKRKQTLRRTISFVVVAAIVVGIAILISHHSSPKKASKSTTTTQAGSTAQAVADKAAVAGGCSANPQATLPNPQFSAPPMTINTAKTYTATIRTDAGTIVAHLDAKSAPVSVNDFVFLADKGYYRCVTFSRVIPSFVDQTGDPTGTGAGSAGYTVQGEVPATANPQYPLGSLAMAKTSAAPNGTSSNQFFIVAGPQGESLPPDYALFGHVTSGQSVVQAINAGGDSADNGTPPKVIHRILSVSISVS